MRAKVGDRYVLEELAARGWQLGGEGSGHLLALDRHTTGDGIVSALQVLQARAPQRRQRWRSCCDGVTLFPQTLINVRLADGVDWRQNPRLAGDAGRGRRANWATQGRVLIRASGTEPVLRVMVEARDAAAVRALARAHRRHAALRRLDRLVPAALAWARPAIVTVRRQRYDSHMATRRLTSGVVTKPSHALPTVPASTDLQKVDPC